MYKEFNLKNKCILSFLEFSRIFMLHCLGCTVVLHYWFLVVNSKMNIFKQIHVLIFQYNNFLKQYF